MKKFYKVIPLFIVFIVLFSVKSYALDYPANSNRATLSSDALASWFYSNSGSSNYSFVSDPSYIGNWGKGTPVFTNAYEVDFSNLCNVMLELNNHGYTCKIYVDSYRRAYIQATNNIIWKNQADAQVNVSLGFVSIGRELTVPVGYYFTQASYNCYYTTQDLKLIYCDLSSEYETILTNIYNILGTISSSVSSVYNYVVLQYSRLGTIESYIDSVESQLSSIINNTSASGPIVQAINAMSTNVTNAIMQKQLTVDLGNVEVDASSIQFSFDQIIPYLRSLVASTDFGSISADYFFTRNSVPLVNLYGRQYYYQGSKNKYFDQYIYNADLYYIEYTTYGQTVSDMLYDSTTGSYIESITGYSTPQNWYLRVYKLPQNHQFRIWTDYNYHYPLYCGPSWLLPKEYADLLGSEFSYFSKLSSIDSHIQSISIPNYNSKLDTIITSLGSSSPYNYTSVLNSIDSKLTVLTAASIIDSVGDISDIFDTSDDIIDGFTTLFNPLWSMMNLIDDTLDLYIVGSAADYIFGVFQTSEWGGTTYD